MELAVLTGYPLKASLLEEEALFSESYVLCVSPMHQFAKRESIRLEELSGENYVRRSHCEKGPAVMATIEERGISLNINLSTDQDEFARKMVGAGLGVSLLPVSQVRPPLCAIPLEDITISREIRLVHRKEKLLSPIANRVKNSISVDRLFV